MSNKNKYKHLCFVMHAISQDSSDGCLNCKKKEETSFKNMTKILQTPNF